MNNNLIAIIVEGQTELAIMTLLLEKNALIYDEDDLLNGEIITTRKGNNFAKRYLNKGFGSRKIKILRILDSKNENFKLPLVYRKKISEVKNLRTRPEIEILAIIYHDDYQKYTNNYKSKLKPSEYVKQYYSDLKKVKSYKDNYDFWNQHFDKLITVLKQYKQYHPDEGCIADILK